MESNTALTPQKAFIVPIIITAVMGIILFLPAGSLEFWEAWVYLLEFSLLTFFIAAYFLKKSPELLQRRMRLDTKATTKRPPAVLNLFFLGFIVPGLDFRFGWSNVSLWTVIIANVIFCLGYMLVIRVFKENSYASTAIQTEKEQPVITTGPYAFVRHPMYVGLLGMFLSTSLALGSYWAIAPFLLSIPLNVFRIQNEEKVLLENLNGYTDYCQKVPYRLVPFVW